MAIDIVQYAFSAGEISPQLFGRNDLDNYTLGLAKCQNFYVDYRGGITTKPGSQFGDFIWQSEFDVKLIPFKFSTNVANTYGILFGNGYIRFVQDNGYVLENAKTITGLTKANPGIVTLPSHGYVTGDWLILSFMNGMSELEARTVSVGATTTNTFTLLDPFGDPIDTSAYSTFISGISSRIYTLISPYDAGAIADLRSRQIRDLVRLTHPEHPVRNLIRLGHANWILEEETFGADIESPASAPTLTASGTASAGIVVAVTAVDSSGEESLPSPKALITNSVNYSTESGSLKITWPAVTGASFYKVYRSRINPTGSSTTRAEEVGFIGRAYGPVFIDTNIIPDFLGTPPQYYNPFASGAIRFISITNGGSGYTAATTVTVSGGGSGFVGYPVVTDGKVVAVVIVNGGAGYVNPTFTFSVGTGATAVATTSPTSGNFPGISEIFQQRQIYAATKSQPGAIFASRPGRLSNFDGSVVVAANDSYEFEIESDESNPILHLLATRSGMLIMSNSGIWTLTAGANEAVTPINALAEPQTFNGVSKVPPLRIDTDILYLEGKGSAARLLEYNDYTKVYASKTVSILSNHLMSSDNSVTGMAFAADPSKVVWSVRQDGALLAFTVLKDEKVFGWGQCWTKGFYRDIISLPENDTDAIYVIVERLLNNRWVKVFERHASKTFKHIEDAWCLDCALALDSYYPQAQISVNGAEGEVIFTTDNPIFETAHVGAILRMRGGKAEITEIISATEAYGIFKRNVTEFLPESDGIIFPAASGEWTLDIPVTEVSGLWHLEGEVVSALCDGNVVKNLLVSNGTVQLPYPSTRVIVGIPFKAVAQTLPLSTDQILAAGKRKRVVGLAVRVNETRGLRVGADEDNLYSMRERTNESWAEPTKLFTGIKMTLVKAAFNDEGQTVIVQDSPLPATILGVVWRTEIGDLDDRL